MSLTDDKWPWKVMTSSGKYAYFDEKWYDIFKKISISATDRQLLYTVKGTKEVKQVSRTVHGETRQGWYVHFKDGDRYNCRPENLYSNQVKQEGKSSSVYTATYGNRLKGVCPAKHGGYNAQLSVFGKSIMVHCRTEELAALTHDAMVRFFGVKSHLNYPDTEYEIPAERKTMIIRRWNDLYNRSLADGKTYPYGKLLEV